ncbi:tail fiber protein [Nissabacter sp. SGAir0207]|uniref:beta strand repeat-containing protein n=1 Tax=Nissabacter sp. SGAir0207 TaxID=2126321 RepID=UPI0010CD6064|nr:tail fiber protein [Nissabacter sp. SGAir0207]QCR38728.1 hypothetical protein C1N62_21570 [Nissabacter sp. SGAir0207]
MSDSAIVTAKSFPQPETLTLISDVQFREPYSSAAINRKLRGIIGAGIYQGFTPSAGRGLKLLISSGAEGGTCSFNIGAYYQLTVRQQADVTLTLTAGASWVVALQATYAIGTETSQVNSGSTIQAAEIVILKAGTALAGNQLELCKVTIPAGATQITQAMIDQSGRVMQTLGIELSSAIDSSNETVAANSLAVKNAIAKVNSDISASVTTKALAVNGDMTGVNATLTGSMLTNYRIGLVRSDGYNPYITFARTDSVDGLAPTADMLVQGIYAKTSSTSNDFNAGRSLSAITTYHTTSGGGRMYLQARNASNAIAAQLVINGDTATGTFTGALKAEGTLSVAGALSAAGDVSASKALTVAGVTTLAGSVNVTNGLSVMGDNIAMVLRPATADTGYYIRGKKYDGTSHWYFGQAANSTDAVQWGNSLGGSAIALGAGGAITMTGAVSVSSALSASSDITGSGALTLTGAAVLGSTLKVSGATTLSNTLTVVSEAAFGGGLNLGGTYTGGDYGKSTGIYGGADGASTTANNMLLKSWYGIGFYNTSSAGTPGITAYINTRTGYFYTTGSIGAAGSLAVTGTTTLSNWLKVTGATTLSSTLAVTGAVSAGGDITASGSLILTGAATMGSSLNVTGALSGTDATFTQSVVANYRMGVIRNGGLPYTTYARSDLPDGTLPTADTQVMAIQAKTGSTNTNFDAGRILGLFSTFYTTLGGGRNVIQARNSLSAVTSQLTMDGDQGTLSVVGAVSTNSTLTVAGKTALNGGMNVAGGTVMQADNGILYLKPATLDKAYYIQAQKGDGTRHWFLGQSVDSSDVVVLSSYLTTASVQLFDNTVKLTAATARTSAALSTTTALSVGTALTVSGTALLAGSSTVVGGTLSVTGSATMAGPLYLNSWARIKERPTAAQIDAQGMYLSWNYVDGYGRASFLNQRGGGEGDMTSSMAAVATIRN